MEVETEVNQKKKVSFRVLLHYTNASEGDEKSEDGENIVSVDSSANLSSLASKFLQQLYQQGKVDGKQIMKASNVKVLIQVRPTWKPLPLSSFAYKQKETDLSLQNVFGKFLFVDDNQMMVHLHLCDDNVWTDQSVRDVVKKLLDNNYSQTQLERLNCPFSQGMLSQISRDQYYCKVSAEKVRLFGLWYDTMIVSNQENDGDEHEEPAKRTHLSPRGKKIVFSVTDELPLLKAWYDNQSHPSSQEMVKFAKDLNETEFRKSEGREKVDFRHVNNWFKNERARARKTKSMAVSQVKHRPEYSVLETGDNEEGVCRTGNERDALL